MVYFIPVKLNLNVNKIPKFIDDLSNSLKRVGSNVGGIWRIPRIRRLADDLVSLAFWHDGMREQIEELAKVRGRARTETTIPELSRKFNESQAEVTEVVERLKRARNTWITEQFDSDIAEKLDRLIQLKVGSGYIRDKLSEVAKTTNGYDEGEAGWLLREIDEFNEQLFALHKTISGKDKSPGNRVGKAKKRIDRSKDVGSTKASKSAPTRRTPVAKKKVDAALVKRKKPKTSNRRSTRR